MATSGHYKIRAASFDGKQLGNHSFMLVQLNFIFKDIK